MSTRSSGLDLGEGIFLDYNFTQIKNASGHAMMIFPKFYDPKRKLIIKKKVWLILTSIEKN